MSFRILFRLSGIALIGGGILLAIGYAISSLLLPQGFIEMYSNPLAIFAYVLRILGAMSILLGLPTVFARQTQKGKFVALSFIGFIMTFLGIATLEVGINTMYAFLFPPLATNPATQPLLISLDANRPLGASIAFGLGLLWEFLGFLILGIAILRARVLPRVAGVMFILVPVLTVFALPDILLVQAVLGVAFAGAVGLGFALCGYDLLSYQSQEILPHTVEAEPQREPVEV